MTNYLKAAGNILKYLLIYLFVTFMCICLYTLHTAFLFWNSASYSLEIMLNKTLLYDGSIIISIAGLISLYIYNILLKNTEKDLFERCELNKMNVKTFLFSIACALGLSLLFSAYFCLFKCNLLHMHIKLGKLSILAIFCAIFPMAIFMEILFRGLIFYELKKRLNLTTSIIIQSIIFALMHDFSLKIIYFIIFGLILGLICVWTNSLWYSITTHIMFNLFNFVIFPNIKKYILKYPIFIGILGCIILSISLFLLYKHSKKNNATCCIKNLPLQ